MGEPLAKTDAELVAAAAGGSQSAFRALYRAYARPVFWLAHGLLGDTADAEDVMQETFLVAWRRLPQLDLASDSLLPWLVTICRFQSANRMRRQRRDREHTAAAMTETIPAAVDVEEQVIGSALAERVLAEVGTLSPLDQQIFRLCATEGYAYQAAAAELGVSHAVVRNRLSRVRTRLRTVIGSEGS
ncbi:sigma-70 family RNA polymerase sigma factor [Microbacterium sp. EYE_5]|uniref:RNA polymerase sigma factor n=1 Tax=unclassified Microbacterium TaxID=2609290 RepID=UPI002004857E|nr:MULTISPECIES: sigma-70 family RNA polymerase sigma factor [unclassified Microbacterium]MCK6080898.1 sigma-70 family RNA polymerase sigma factor [Microbacterium sp. EYE_382]MCK6086169.1 sigma-70 family RNA polymerase sigma factor [Microbacterium sp. EYE_384]MCK6124333.1 sigma-70 family RNA polymerase sigma factor [Microbacterium sp. EYE_80]MCK6127242.1 sigma-70 family RNA polymerase sigma factor [Microbacterium sp. EYE_79]MCK6141853.1 sigma-70 family RNA polymerase sigma factor [Microbacteri